jgi:protein TonB
MYFKIYEKHSFYFMKKLSFLFLLLFICNNFLFAQVTDTIKTALDTALFTQVDVEAQFPGGEANWNLYVQRTLEKKIDRLVRNKKSFGTCEVQFIVGNDGSLTNVEALTLKNSLLAKILIQAIKEGPKWVPAEQNGRKVKAWRRQKVTFLPPKD